MFKLLRYYTVASFVAVLATVVLLTWFYRQVAIQGISELADRNNVDLAELAMIPIKPALLAFLDTTLDLGPGGASPPLTSELAGSINTLMQDRSVVKIKIYNRHGVVAFSTRPAEVGKDQSRNEGFIAAIGGGVGHELIYRDTFNRFDGLTEKDNLMQTYLPVRAGPAEPIKGVFELYTDVNNLVHQTERIQFIVVAGAILILSAMYAVLILIVRHASRTIELQQRTIRERTETLQHLSAQMLKSEESYKQKIAFELHEGLAQTLAAVKLKAEHGRHKHNDVAAAAGSEDSFVPALQEAIQEVRAIATDLRPASLDDLGLLPTINSLCREFEQRHPGIRIEQRISLEESDVKASLKVIVYRIIVAVLGDMVQHPRTSRIQLVLELNQDDVMLLINDSTTDACGMTAAPAADITPQLRAGFARMEELTTLSGGAFTATRHPDGGTTLCAVWSG